MAANRAGMTWDDIAGELRKHGVDHKGSTILRYANGAIKRLPPELYSAVAVWQGVDESVIREEAEATGTAQEAHTTELVASLLAAAREVQKNLEDSERLAERLGLLLQRSSAPPPPVGGKQPRATR